jgi:cholesterol oxidase
LDTHLDQLLSGKGSQAQASGFVNCDALGGKLPLEGGTFRLFVGDEPHRKTMCYRLHCRDAVGHPLTLSGVKIMQKSRGREDKGSSSRVWRDTTTLYLRVVQGWSGQDVQAEEAKAEVVASGILHLGLLSFAKQLTTFRAAAPSSIGQLAAVARFGGFFLRQLWQVYGARLEHSP